MPPKIAVLTFPGNNCENETVRALDSVGFDVQKIRWNESSKTLLSFDGVVIPGGFSFEDRGRSGVISAQEPIFRTLKEMAKAGKPIMGICNGAQMVVESGLILETAEEIPAVALLKNKRMNQRGEILGTGFYHSWRTLKPIRTDTPFSQFSHSIRVPLAHGEGRFTVPNHLQSLIREKNLIVFQYVDENGAVDPHYPVNPNGSFENAAAMCNESGNVLAIMPHPERSDAGKAVFESLWNFFQTQKIIPYIDTPVVSFPPRTLHPLPETNVRILVSLNITDNTEKTFSQVLQAPVVRREIWDIKSVQIPSQEALKALLLSGELVNLHKQSVQVFVGGVWYLFSKEDGFSPLSEDPLQDFFLVREKEDFKGKYAQEHLKRHFPDLSVEAVSFGVLWKVEGSDITEMIQKPLFASYVGEEVMEA